MVKITTVLVLFFGWISSAVANVAVMGATAASNGAIAAGSGRRQCIVVTTEVLTREQINQLCGIGSFSFSQVMLIAAVVAIIVIGFFAVIWVATTK